MQQLWSSRPGQLSTPTPRESVVTGLSPSEAFWVREDSHVASLAWHACTGLYSVGLSWASTFVGCAQASVGLGPANNTLLCLLSVGGPGISSVTTKCCCWLTMPTTTASAGPSQVQQLPQTLVLHQHLQHAALTAATPPPSSSSSCQQHLSIALAQVTTAACQCATSTVRSYASSVPTPVPAQQGPQTARRVPVCLPSMLGLILMQQQVLSQQLVVATMGCR